MFPLQPLNSLYAKRDWCSFIPKKESATTISSSVPPKYGGGMEAVNPCAEVIAAIQVPKSSCLQPERDRLRTPPVILGYIAAPVEGWDGVRSTNRGLSVSISLGNPGAHGCHTEARPQIVNEDAFYGQRRVRLPHRQGRMNAINTTDVVSQQAALPSQSTEKKNAGNVLHFRTDQKDHDLDHLQIRNVTI